MRALRYLVGNIWSEKPSDLARTCYYALYALQHRGQEGAGIAVAADDGIVSRKDAGLVNDVFTSSVLSSFPETTMAISHVRYGTTGINPRLNVGLTYSLLSSITTSDLWLSPIMATSPTMLS